MQLTHSQFLRVVELEHHNWGTGRKFNFPGCAAKYVTWKTSRQNQQKTHSVTLAAPNHACHKSGHYHWMLCLFLGISTTTLPTASITVSNEETLCTEKRNTWEEATIAYVNEFISQQLKAKDLKNQYKRTVTWQRAVALRPLFQFNPYIPEIFPKY